MTNIQSLVSIPKRNWFGTFYTSKPISLEYYNRSIFLLIAIGINSIGIIWWRRIRYILLINYNEGSKTKLIKTIDIGTSTPLIFQHGLAADMSQISSLFSDLPDIRLCGIDCSGHGLSVASDSHYLVYDQYTRFIKAWRIWHWYK